MNTRPLFLTLIILVYLACSAWPVFWGPSRGELGSVLLAAVLALFAFHGSAIACNILAIVCVVAAHRTLGDAVEVLSSSALSAALLAAIAAGLAVTAHYLLFGKAVRAFQGKPVTQH